MSFRTRLALFFFLIVVLPMVALAIVVVQIADDSASGKTDAQIAAKLDTGRFVNEMQLSRATGAARAIAEGIASDPSAVATLEEGGGSELAARAKVLAREHGAASLRINDPGGSAVVRLGPRLVASARLRLRGTDGSSLGTLFASVTTPSELLAQIRRITSSDALLLDDSGILAGNLSVTADAVPEIGESDDIDVEGEELRISTSELPGGEGVALGIAAEPETEAFFASSPVVATALAAFFGIALVAVLVLTRTLAGQVRSMLEAARRIGGGDFSRTVPVVGSDEMADLASEFNKMSERLSEQIDQLRRQRVEIDRSVRRIGEATAAGLDRPALLAILADTAVSAAAADYGVIVLSGHVSAEAEAGSPDDALRDAALAAEYLATRDQGLIDVEHEGVHSLASALGEVSGGELSGVMSIARRGQPFSDEEREVFLYLLGQAGASVENLALHELVAEQAMTDDLTGLANSRAFRRAIEREAARAERFSHNLSLLLLDLDNFKRVNDTYGHPQGDEVLRAIGRILDAESRGIDTPARYGGEEFVVALPETDPDGALELAERIRERIESEPVPLLAGGGELHVTASVGAATMPGSAWDVKGLIAATDSALYEAKRQGRNRVAQAPSSKLDAPSPADSR